MRTEQMSKAKHGRRHKRGDKIPKSPKPTFEPDYAATQKDLKNLASKEDLHALRNEIKSDLKWIISGLYALTTIGFIALGVLISIAGK